jgi:hypothetical protein
MTQFSRITMHPEVMAGETPHTRSAGRGWDFSGFDGVRTFHRRDPEGLPIS